MQSFPGLMLCFFSRSEIALLFWRIFDGKVLSLRLNIICHWVVIIIPLGMTLKLIKTSDYLNRQSIVVNFCDVGLGYACVVIILESEYCITHLFHAKQKLTAFSLNFGIPDWVWAWLQQRVDFYTAWCCNSNRKLSKNSFRNGSLLTKVPRMSDSPKMFTTKTYHVRQSTQKLAQPTLLGHSLGKLLHRKTNVKRWRLIKTFLKPSRVDYSVCFWNTNQNIELFQAPGFTWL